MLESKNFYRFLLFRNRFYTRHFMFYANVLLNDSVSAFADHFFDGNVRAGAAEKTALHVDGGGGRAADDFDAREK